MVHLRLVRQTAVFAGMVVLKWRSGTQLCQRAACSANGRGVQAEQNALSCIETFLCASSSWLPLGWQVQAVLSFQVAVGKWMFCP